MTILFFAKVLHVIVAVALTLIVLLQTGKGSDLASAFGGGGQNAMFGGAGPASFLNKMTTAVAVLFMATSVTLAYLSSQSTTIMQDQAVVEETVGETATEDEGAAVPDSSEAVSESEETTTEAAPETE